MQQPPPRFFRNNQGFTLVELSLVLVIVGLLIGGILVGQSMLSTAKTQQLIKTANQYIIAARNFKTTYNYYPGDYPRADFGCAGDGDGMMKFFIGPNCVVSGQYNTEGTNFFVHLSRAQMLPYNYTYVGSGTYPVINTAGVNVPKGPDKNSYFMVNYFYQYDPTLLYNSTNTIGVPPIVGANSSYLFYSADCTVVSTYSSIGNLYECAILTTADTLAIDKKIDDGMPNTGAFLGAEDMQHRGYMANWIADGSGSCARPAGVTGTWNPYTYTQRTADSTYNTKTSYINCIPAWRIND